MWGEIERATAVWGFYIFSGKAKFWGPIGSGADRLTLGIKSREKLSLEEESIIKCGRDCVGWTGSTS